MDGVAGELCRIELAGCDEEVVDRLLGLDPEDERRIPELQVEVDEQRALDVLVQERGGEVRRHGRLAAAALRPEHREHPRRTGRGMRPLRGRCRARPGSARSRAPAAQPGDTVDRLRQHEHIGDTRRQCLLEEPARLAVRQQDDRLLGVLAQPRELVAGQRVAGRRMKDDRRRVALEHPRCGSGRR